MMVIIVDDYNDEEMVLVTYIHGNIYMYALYIYILIYIYYLYSCVLLFICSVVHLGYVPWRIVSPF